MSFGERFLHNPDLFPARAGGEVWGDREIVLELPGGPYRFGGLSRAQAAIVEDRFGELCRPPAAGTRLAGSPHALHGLAAGGQEVSCLLFRVEAGAFRTFDLRGWEYSLDCDATPAALRLAGLDLIARLDWRPSLGGALWTPDGGGERFAGIFENFCRVLVAYRLVELGGAVLHSAGVVRHGAAFLFLGRSGAGKTTISAASLARGAEVLSDDINALLPAPGGAQVAKLPFTGDLGERRSTRRHLPLAAVLWLEKASADELTSLSRAAALACLFSCAPFVNSDPHRREALLANLARLLPPPGGGGPLAFNLRFSRAGTFWSILDEKWSQLKPAPS
jgi:hypothetical protein